MKQNEITGLMRDAGFDNLPEADYWYPSFKHFAKLVAQHEREKNIKICQELAKDMTPVAEFAAKLCAKSIEEQA